MPRFKPAYLICGDDHARIGERRARLRALAEGESGASGVELLEGDAATVEATVDALRAMTFSFGRRFVIIDGVERWRERDVAELLAPLLATIAPDTTIAFFGREAGRAKVPGALRSAVQQAGGDVGVETSLKEWQLPKWVVEHARGLKLELDSSAARALVAVVGDRQQRLARELERLALALEPGARVDADTVAELAAGSAERRVWTLADALVAGDRPGAVRAYLRLRSQGERLESLSFWMVRRLREALGVARRLERGEPPAQIKRSLRMPPRAAEQFIADVRRSDARRLAAALAVLADLELHSRGGSPLEADTLALRSIGQIAA